MAVNVRPVMEQKLYLINHRYQQPGLPCGVRYPERLIFHEESKYNLQNSCQADVQSL
jgi:hypothetical protein